MSKVLNIHMSLQHNETATLQLSDSETSNIKLHIVISTD